MKTRNGFVSNSSSSSFVIGFKQKPKSVAEMKRILFGKDDTVTYYDESLSTDRIADTVYNDIKNQLPATVKQIDEEIRSGWFSGYPEISINKEFYTLAREFTTKYKNLSWYDPDKLKNKEAKKLAIQIKTISDENEKSREDALKKAFDEYIKEVMPKLKGLTCFIVSYSDNSGEAVMEHGGIFDRIPHVRISHH
jgi:hypothetical protein